MVRKKIVLVAGALLLLAIGVFASAELIRAQTPVPPLTSRPGPPFVPRPLVGAPAEEVAEQAIAFTRGNYPLLSGEATVRLVRPVTTADLPALGLPRIGFSAQEPELMLVILQGDFDVRNMRGRGRLPLETWHWRVGFIGYVFDLRAGVPALVMTTNGERFRIVLNDPSLPADVPKVPPQIAPTPKGGLPEFPLPPGAKPTVPPEQRAPYGSIAPTVSPPPIPGR